MSIQAVSWAIENTDLPPVERMVLVAFAYRANKDGGGSRPSIATVCRETGAHRSTVIRIKQKLIDEGYLVPEGTHIRGTVVYRLPIDLTSRTARLVAESDQSDSTSRTARPPLVAQRDLTSRTARPEPSLTVLEPSLSKDQNDLVKKIEEVISILDQLKTYDIWVDRMGIENTISAFPNADHLKAARNAVAFAADPSRRGDGNAARILWRALQFQDSDQSSKTTVKSISPKTSISKSGGKHLQQSRNQWNEYVQARS